MLEERKKNKYRNSDVQRHRKRNMLTLKRKKKSNEQTNKTAVMCRDGGKTIATTVTRFVMHGDAARKTKRHMGKETC